MNRFKLFYVIIIILSLIMIFTKGFYGSIIVNSYDDINRGIIDGFQGNVFLSIINCSVIAIITILTLIITFNKNNKINIKWLVFVVIILLVLCIPIGTHHYSGGIAGIIGENSIYLWDIITYLVR